VVKNRSGRRYTDNYYQAVAKRTPVVAAFGPLLLRSSIRRALHGLHPSDMSQIEPFDLAGGDDPYSKPPGPHGARALHPGDTRTRLTDGTSDNSARVTTVHGAPPLRALHPLRQLHPSDCLHHGLDVGARIPIEGFHGERPALHRQRIRQASAAAIARCRVDGASRSTARRCSAAATLSARTGS